MAHEAVDSAILAGYESYKQRAGTTAVTSKESVDPSILDAYESYKQRAGTTAVTSEKSIPPSILTAYPREKLSPAHQYIYDRFMRGMEEPEERKFDIFRFMDIIPGVRQIREGVELPTRAGPTKFGLKPLAESVREISKGITAVPEMAGGGSLSEQLLQPLAEIPSFEVPIPGVTQDPTPLATTTGGPGKIDLNALAALFGPSFDVPPPAKGKVPVTVDLGVLANFLTGIPGTAIATMADVPGEFAAQEIEALPETLALGPMASAVGMGLRAGGKAVKAGAKALGGEQVLKDIGEAFQFRGGMTPRSAASFGRKDVADIKAAQLATGVRKALTEAPSGRAYTMEEQRFLGQLLEQPGQREALRRLNETPQDISTAAEAAFRAAARPVKSVTGAKGIAARAELPMSEVALKDFVRAADDVAKVAGSTGKRLVETFGKDPVAWSRFTELNYNPRRFAGATMGVFPTRGLRERTGFFKRRSEQYDEARKTQGLITEPGGPMSMTILQEQRAVSTRTLFNDLSRDPMTVIRPVDPSDLAMPTGQGRMINGQRYIKMGEDESLGPLAGTLVRAQEAGEINALIRKPGALGRTVREWWQAWKFGKTVMSPKTHIRNGMSNAMLAHAEGLSPYRLDIYATALGEIKHQGGTFWKEAKDAGASWTVRRGTSLDDVLHDADMRNADSIYEAWARALPRWLTRNKSSQKMAEAYADSEALFKQALFIYKRRNGIPISQAIQESDRAILNYGNMPAWVKQVRTIPTGIPFISFAYGVTPIVAQTALKNPRIFQHYKLFRDAWNTVAAEAAEATPEELEAINTLYQDSFPMIQPFRDAHGKLHVWDVSRSTPVSQLPAMMDPLSYLMANPIIAEAATQLTGYDPFRKKQIFEPETPLARAGAEFFGLSKDPRAMDFLFKEPARQRKGARAEHLLRTVAPSPVGDLMNFLGATGKENIFGTPFTREDAILAALVGASKNVSESIPRAELAVRKQTELGIEAAKKKALREKEKQSAR